MSLTAIVFLVCFAAGIGLAFFRHPIFGLYTYIAVFYLDAPHRWWGQGLPDLRWSFVTAIVTVIAMSRLKADPQRTPWFKTLPAAFLILYTVWLWIQSPWALDPEMHRECSIMFSKFIIVYYMVYRLVDTPMRAGDFLLAQAVGCLYLGLIAFGTDAPGGRLEGVGGAGIDDSNTLGMHAAAIAAATALLIFVKRDWRRYVAVVAVLLTINMVVLTGSRGAFLALFLGGVAIYVMRPRENSRVFYTLAFLGILGFGMVASESFWKRMQTMEAAVNQEETLDNSAEGRIVQMRAGIHMFAAHPLGVGHRGFATLSPRYLDKIYLTESGARSSHNTFISCLVEQGVPGAALYLIVWFWVMKSCLVARRWAIARRPLLEVCVMTATCAGLVTIFIGGQFADFLKAEVQVWLLALLASLRFMPSSIAPGAPATRRPGSRATPLARARQGTTVSRELAPGPSG